MTNTDATVVAVLERIRPASERYVRGEITDAQYTSITQMKGWSSYTNHIALDANLRYLVISFLCFDWMRMYFVSGIFVRETKAFLDHKPFSKLGSAADIHNYFMQWAWPR